jgi:hypothetical protein
VSESDDIKISELEIHGEDAFAIEATIPYSCEQTIGKWS